MFHRFAPLVACASIGLAAFAAQTVTAQPAAPTVAPELAHSAALAAKHNSRVYIVQLGADPLVAYDGGISGLAATKPATGAKLDMASADVQAYQSFLLEEQDSMLASVGGGKKLYNYTNAFNGFAARMTEAQANQLSAMDGVRRVFPDEIRQMQTDNTPKYLRLRGGNGAWSYGATGEDVIVGIIDSGIWPEHPSFADVPTPMYGDKGPLTEYGPPPAGWSGDACEFGNSNYNANDAEFACNNKLLGARFYFAGFGEAGLLPEEFLSARDQDGHGSHVGATAAGNWGVDASIEGEDLGRVSGIAPRARVAAYKICWNGSFPPEGFSGGCASSDAMAAIDQAVADGVDVINYSIGGPSTTFGGADDIAFLFAADAGVFVAAAQGNSGPDADTTGTPAGVPWLTSVGATADNQVFNNGLDVVSSDASATGLYEGVEAAISLPLTESGAVTADLIAADDGVGDGTDACEALANADEIAGNVALIQRGGCAFTDKFLNAQAAGASAVVVYNNAGSPFTMGGDGTGIEIPGLMISQADGGAIVAALDSGADTSATLSEDLQFSKDNTVAVFSSRGANLGEPDIIKPDVSAPGVAILAATTPFPNDGQLPGQLFQNISGTSMASPHIAGVGAILAQAYPDWSPAMIRSAIMTSAANGGLKESFGDELADPFDVGAGVVRADRAFEPGLVYDADLFDYVRYTCGSQNQAPVFSPGTCAFFGGIDASNLNLPSIGIAELVGSETIVRTVTSVLTAPEGLGDGTWPFSVRVTPPAGVKVDVSPTRLALAAGESASYTVTMTVRNNATYDEWSFGNLEWRTRSPQTGALIRVRSPIAAKPSRLSAPDGISVADAATDGSTAFDVFVGYNGELSAEVLGLTPAEVIPGAVATGGNSLQFVFVPPGTRIAEFSLFDESVGDGSGFDDLDLQIQGPDTAGFPFVAISGNAASNETVTLVDPEPGFYAAFILHFATAADVTNYELNAWSVVADDGNATVTVANSVSTGTTESVSVDWSALEAGTRYRGAVVFSSDSEEIDITSLAVDTAD
ncbi:MAG: S8 family serine peptidase [Pseudomonadaceae bacterium]|nr:S8 family serine peptidase [Pseudomonadaceae bacterium]